MQKLVENGREVTRDSEILECVRNFYDLYSSKLSNADENNPDRQTP
jgi:hypothetical protein